MQCAQRYYLNEQGICEHYIWPLSTKYIISMTILIITNGLSTIAGIGGGALGLIIFMLGFDYTPKDATLVVLCSIFGASTGNILNLMRKAFNGRPLINYRHVLLLIAIIFTGSFVGILLNKYLPSVGICSMILFIRVISVKKSYRRFRQKYEKQTQQNQQQIRKSNIIVSQQINPFAQPQNVYIAKNIILIMFITIVLSLLRGSEKFPSLIHIVPCSISYWLFYLLSFITMACIAYRNIHIVQKLCAPSLINSQGHIMQHTNIIHDNITKTIKMGVIAGVYTGLGMGGGVVIMPLLRDLGLNPLEATSTSSLCVFISSFINCIQAISVGVIIPSQFIFYSLFLGVCSYFTSKLISQFLRKRNRLSLAQGIFVVINICSIFLLPYSLYRKSVINPDSVFGFGSLC